MTIILALISAALFGAGVALQQRPASEVPIEYAARPGLMLRVARQGWWLVGFGAEIAGFVLQILALRHGSLVLVQPLITTSLIFTIAMAGTWHTKPITLGEWAAVISVVAGLAAFLAVAAPSEHSSGLADWKDWVLTTVCVAAGLGLLVAYGLRSADRSRAAALGLAAGLGDALMAVLTKAFAHETQHGIGGILTSWVPYALCVSGLIAVLLTQTAYQTGLPKVSLPLITVAEPLISCGIGVGLFGEVIHLDGLRGPVVLAAIGVMAVGLLFLSRSSVAQEPVPSR